MTYDHLREGNGSDRDEIEALRHRIQELGADFASVDRRLRLAVRERPVVALITALAAGFMLGRIIGRS